MSIPLLGYAPKTINARIAGYEVGSDDQPKIYTAENLLSPGDMGNLIEAAYRQIFFHAFKSDREPFLESQLRSGQITVRDFIRGLLLSDTYKRTFYGFNSNYRFVEQCVQRILGRDVHGEAEKISWSIIVASKGLEAFVDALLDSEEYLDNFGFDTVPYQRRRVLPGRDKGDVPFNVQSPRYDAYYRKILGFPSGTWTGTVRRYTPGDGKPKVGDHALYMDMVRSMRRRAITGSPTAASNIDMSKVPYRKTA